MGRVLNVKFKERPQEQMTVRYIPVCPLPFLEMPTQALTYSS